MSSLKGKKKSEYHQGQYNSASGGSVWVVHSLVFKRFYFGTKYWP